MTKHIRVVWLICLTIVASAAFRASAQQKAQVDYAKEIHPILQTSCYACHGSQKSLAGLRLDNKESAMKGGVSGAVIIAGNGKDSRLVHRIMGLDDEMRMPMKGEPLTPAQIETIKTWIDQGAQWPDEDGNATKKPTAASTSTSQKNPAPSHWAYLVPSHPQPPDIVQSAWVRTPVDNFVLARLEKENLTPSPEASKETLVRRLFLDLTGLPPAPKDVDDFLADVRPDAYEKLVDRLLGDPHYGERWARPWLDLARYADTNGYEKDRRREMWEYRDWVINALNNDLPFDEFTIEQLAGDMLPAPTTEQKIATGFHRNTMLNQEGGVDTEEARWETLLDRVNTTSTVWLGSTLACAQCHNHKYDPFTQKDYYRMLAFFDNADYHVEGEGDKWVREPQLDLPTPEQKGKRDALKSEMSALETQLDTSTPALASAQLVWEKEIAAAATHWVALDPLTFSSHDATTLTKNADKSLSAGGINPDHDTYLMTARVDLPQITGIRLEALTDPGLPRGGPGRDAYGDFVLTDFTVTTTPDSAVGGARASSPSSAPLIFKAAQADDWSGDDPKNLIAGANDGGGNSNDRNAAKNKGWAVDATKDRARVSRQIVFATAQPLALSGANTITIKLGHHAEDFNQGIGRFRLSVTSDPDPFAIVRIPARLRPVLDTPESERSADQRRALAAHYRTLAPSLQIARDRLARLRAEWRNLGIVSTGVMQERASYEWPATYLRLRGAYLNKGEKVYAAVPSVLPQLPEGQLPNRLGLARWIASADNPLTARVTVNRYWEQLFGRGIVETSEDFGSQGEAPTHPELLDWLATEFVARKWSPKAMIRLMVTSATYKQSSAATPALIERDPYNKLLARGPRFRMEAEMIRDVALAASGELSDKIGGPSVFPPQPDGIWDLPYNDDQWKTSEGADRYRRALYTFLRRTSPYPSFLTFDAPSREVCTVRRVRTNTPLQSLTTLNDPAFFDAARALAKRMQDEGGTDASSRLTYGFRLCTARRPKTAESSSLLTLYRQQLINYTRDQQAARRASGGAQSAKEQTVERGTSAAYAERAALTIVANVLLNLDETLTKE